MTTADFVKLIPICSKPEIAAWYAMNIRYVMGGTDWPAINEAIIKAHSNAYLVRVKTRAWQIVRMLDVFDSNDPRVTA